MLKKVILFAAGVGALILVLMVFLSGKHSTELEMKNLSHWQAAGLDRRASAVRILIASDENTDAIVQCVDKMATLPDAGNMEISVAVSLCHSGMQLRENL